MVMPPSRRSIWPHIWLEDGLHRNTTPCAISQGSAKRPSGVRSIMGSPFSGSLQQRDQAKDTGVNKTGRQEAADPADRTESRSIRYRCSTRDANAETAGQSSHRYHRGFAALNTRVYIYKYEVTLPPITTTVKSES